MLRSITTTGLKQSQRVSTKSTKQLQPTPSANAANSSANNNTVTNVSNVSNASSTASGSSNSNHFSTFMADPANAHTFIPNSLNISSSHHRLYSTLPSGNVTNTVATNNNHYNHRNNNSNSNGVYYNNHHHHNNNNHYYNNKNNHNNHHQGQQAHHNNNNNNNNNNHHFNNQSLTNTYSKQLELFDECLAQNSTYDLATGKISGSNGANQFWFAIKKIIPIYKSLVHSGCLNEKRMAEFVSLLRNGLRIHRLELSKLKKNLDKDSNNPIKNIHYLLTCSIREVSQNLLDGLIKLNSHGLTHLFKAYKDLGFTYEAVHIWEIGKKNPNLYPIFTSESVLGSIFPFLVESGDFNFNEIWEMYNNVKINKNLNEKLHNELQIGMIRVCLFKNKTNDAINIFKQLTNDVYNNSNIEPPINVKSYMTMAHLSFIGFCKDIETADNFFNDAVNESMPYLTPLQLNFIKKYLNNTYEITNNYEKVKNIWLITWNHYESKKTSNSSISSSLNDSFLTIFFNKFPNFNNESFNELKLIIDNYSKIKLIDEPFINVLLSKSTCWHNTQVLEYILNIANSNNFSKTNVFFRCCLKACGSVEINCSNVLNLFRQLLENNALNGMKFIAHADWVALRDATINSPYLLNFNSNSINDRIDLYFKLWKICSLSFISLENFKNYILKDIKLNFNYSKIFQQMSSINISDINIPEINYFDKNKLIETYINYNDNNNSNNNSNNLSPIMV